MNTLLYVSILLIMAHLTPPAGVVQVNEPGFETRVECQTWIQENKSAIIGNIFASFGPWARIIGIDCMTEEDAEDLNREWGHKSLEDYEKKDDDFLKGFGDGKTL